MRSERIVKMDISRISLNNVLYRRRFDVKDKLSSM